VGIAVLLFVKVGRELLIRNRAATMNASFYGGVLKLSMAGGNTLAETEALLHNGIFVPEHRREE
jgi:hypothetical protein